MNKTDDEIEAAVLAECERLCPNKGDKCRINDVLRIDSCVAGKWAIATHGGHVVCFISNESSDGVFQAAYRILGLEAKAEGEKVAKLVEALEKRTNDYIDLLLIEREATNDKDQIDAIDGCIQDAKTALAEWKGDQP